MTLDFMEADERLNREYLNGVHQLKGDEMGRWCAWERMERGDAYYHGLPVAIDFLPRIFSPGARSYFAETVRTTYRILCKVIARYQEDAAFRSLFRFDPRVRELLLIPSGYEEPLPMARFDMLYSQELGRFMFCEFNTDASSGMLENSESAAAVAESEAFWEFSQRHPLATRCEEQYEGWVRRFTELFVTTDLFAERSAGGRPPHVAIAVCLESPNPDVRELEAFQELFDDLGWECSICDVRAFEMRGGRLVASEALIGVAGQPIDAVWRFCVVVDLLKYWDEVQPFIQAARTGAVELIGAFSTQIAHDKQLFALMRRPEVLALLTPDEQAFVAERIPFTAFLDDPELDLQEVRAHPADWVLKPTDWYATKNVTVGSECTPEHWNALIDELLAATDGSPYLVQRFVAPSESAAIPLYGLEADFTAPPRPYGNLFGLYCQCGTFAGVYVRQGPHDVIGSAREGLVAPVFWSLADGE